MVDTIKGKRKARRLALQALYQWHMSGESLLEIETQFRAINNMATVDDVYFSKLFHGVPAELSLIEQHLAEFVLDRKVRELNPIELSILRLSTYELMHCLEIPYKVVLDEAVAITKEFGSQDGHRYVNGVLNGVAKSIRKTEAG